MKKSLVVLFLTGLFPCVAIAAAPELKIMTPGNIISGNIYEVVAKDRVDISSLLPTGTDTRFVLKIPAVLSDIESSTLPGECSIIKRLDVPALIVCIGIDGQLEIRFSGQIKSPVSGSPSGFVAARGFLPDGKRWSYFAKFTLHVKNTVEGSPNPSKTPAPTPASSPQPTRTPTPPPDVSSYENPDDIPTHKRMLSNPVSQIIPDETQSAIVASAHFQPSVEAVIIRKLTVELNDINTGSLYGDIANDSDMIEAVTLWYQDGTPVLTKDGIPAKTVAISLLGKAVLDNLNLAIPEKGERLFIGLDTRAMFENQSGSAVTAEFSFGNNDADIRGFFSENQYGDEIVDAGLADSPTVYILANKLVADTATGGTEILKSGSNEVLPFTLDVLGGDEAYLREVDVDVSKTSSGDGFRVIALRLRRDADIIASRSGGDLTGKQTLTIGQCAGGDVCDPAEEGGAIFKKTNLIVEAVIEPLGDSLNKSNNLTATININSAAPDRDDIVWQDYGTGEDDGVEIRWIDLGREKSLSTLERTISTP